MNINKKNFYIAALFGLLIGSAFTISAFTEPTKCPDTNYGTNCTDPITSYPPINLSPNTQYHYGSLCLGDGTNKVDGTACPVGSLTVKSNLLLDRMTVRQNANFVSDVTVDKRNIVAGLIRAPQVVVDKNTSNAPGHPYTTTNQLYFPNGTTTNLISGNYCTTAANTACPNGSVLYKYDNSSSKAICRYINPVKYSSSLGDCASVSAPTISVSIVKTDKDTNECFADITYRSNAVDATTWKIKWGAGSWEDLGSGKDKIVRVDLTKNTSWKVADLQANTMNKYNLTATANLDVNTVSATYCVKW